MIRLSRVAKLSVLLLLTKSGVSSSQYNFESGFFKAAGLVDSESVDMAIFNKGASFLPGEYKLSVYINDVYFGGELIQFIKSEASSDPVPCFTSSEWLSFGVEIRGNVDSTCAVASDYVAEASWRVDMNNQHLYITVPQAVLKRNDVFKTAWQTWQEGDNALLLNYNYNYSSNQSTTNQYFGLDSGVNLQGFRFRNSSTLLKNGGQKGAVNSIRTYVQKDYHYLQGGEVTLGEISSEGDLFESIPFKGAMLASLDDMLNLGYQNFTPIVRGVVNSQSATITVMQNSYVIYQTTLPSGPFALEGVMSNGGGDYQIQIEESDGAMRSYVQSSDSLPMLQSKGRIKYNILSGKTNFTNVNNQPFSQASLFYGATESVTLYGGVILSDDYQAYNTGLGKMMGRYGAASVDLTKSASKSLVDRAPEDFSGRSLRLSYYKNFDETATSFGLVGYRSSTKDYLSFKEFIDYRSNEYNPNFNMNRRLDINLTQRLGDFGNISLSGGRQSYWSDVNSSRRYNVNHSINFGKVTLNSYFSQNISNNNTNDKVFGLGLALSFYDNGRHYSLANSALRSNERYVNQTSVSTSLLEDNRLHLSLSQNISEHMPSMHGLAASYSGPRYDASAGYYKSSSSQQMNAGIRGGAVLFSDGITLSRSYSMDSPIAIVQTLGESGVMLTNNINTYTDYFGNAVVGNLQPYQRNAIGIDASSLDVGVETAQTDVTIIPRKGSVIPVKFKLSKGLRALFNVTYRGKSIPLGAEASMIDQHSTRQTAFFADRGQVYLTGLDRGGRVGVKWGNSTCEFLYELDSNSLTDLHRKTLECI